MIKMNRYLYNILDDFKEYVNSGVTLCDLKKVHFDAGRIPDYSDIHVQQLYLLRYAYGYGFEYKKMYSSLWERMNHPTQLKVTAVGCGTMIDYWSLTQVVPESCRVEYTGLDVINWSYRIQRRPQDDVRFLRTDAISYFEKAEELTSDVYIFPKSISEFSDEDLQKIGEALCKKVPGNKTIYLLFSLRTDDFNLDEDMGKATRLYLQLVRNGFRSRNTNMTPMSLPEELKDKKIREVDPAFFHPQKVVDFLLTELPTCCPAYIKNGEYCESDCENKLKWWPILNCNQAMWQLFEFRKEGSR